MSNEADLAGQARRRSAVLLRRWLAETHTPVAEGPLRVRVASLRLAVDVVYDSPTGAHGFGPISVLDDADEPVAMADPALLAAACSADARARALPEAPVNSAGTLVDWLLDAVPRGQADPLPLPAELIAEAAAIPDLTGARDWLAAYVERRLLPGIGRADPASLLTRGALAMIGLLGRRGVVHEGDLLAELGARLAGFVSEYPRIRDWLTSPTLPDLAALNGSALCYRDEQGVLGVRPVSYQVRNPLFTETAKVPGVPVPRLSGAWSLRPVGLTGPDVGLVHRWMNTEHVAVNWNQAWPLERWHAELAGQLAGKHSLPCIVARDGREIGYLELYRVRRDKLNRCYAYAPHDLGVHIAIGEPGAIGRGLGSSLLRAVADGLLASDAECLRVVAEPDVRNLASVRAFGKAGFARAAEIGLPNKNSALMVFSRSGEQDHVLRPTGRLSS